MSLFPLDPGYWKWRSVEMGKSGWDVWGVQSGLAGIPGYEKVVVDGNCGASTDAAIRRFQDERALFVDGRAGFATQEKLASVLARKFRTGWSLPNGIPFGSILTESGCWFGNYTAPYSDGSRDLGLVQRNDKAVVPQLSPEDAFDAPGSLMTLCSRISSRWAAYKGYGIVDDFRALRLACGSWNAPAFTDALARGKTYADLGDGVRVDLSLGAPARTRIEDYIAKATRYL